jgi:hypothetical protein
MVHGGFMDGYRMVWVPLRDVLGSRSGTGGVPLRDGWGPAPGRVPIWTSPTLGPLALFLDDGKCPDRVDVQSIFDGEAVRTFSATSDQ